LVDMVRVEQLVNAYVKCWIPKRSNYSGDYEDIESGCEHLQIIRNGFDLEDFDHDELSKLAMLLTRELRGQINRDHKFFWAWSGFLTFYFIERVSLFSDWDWTGSFKDLVNLVLSNVSSDLPQVLRYVNNHLFQTCLSKHQIAGPLTFSVLEGLLRRKNKDYVNKDGSVKRPFSISDPKTGTKDFDPNGPNKRLNRIDESIRCFEELVTVDRGRSCPYLQQMKIEIASLYPSVADVYDMIDCWRNDLIHGKEYWQNKVPMLLNLICLLIIDEIDPSLYDAQKVDIKREVEASSKELELIRIRGIRIRGPLDLFPPDI